jgi:hypothetical protein
MDFITALLAMGIGIHGSEQSKAGVQPHANVKTPALLPISAPL